MPRRAAGESPGEGLRSQPRRRGEEHQLFPSKAGRPAVAPELPGIARNRARAAALPSRSRWRPPTYSTKGGRVPRYHRGKSLADLLHRTRSAKWSFSRIDTPGAGGLRGLLQKARRSRETEEGLRHPGVLAEGLHPDPRRRRRGSRRRKPSAWIPVKSDARTRSSTSSGSRSARKRRNDSGISPLTASRKGEGDRSTELSEGDRADPRAV